MTVENMEIRKEKAILKKKWTNSFLNELEIILEKCFTKHKTKKEHFITKDKIELEIIKLLQSQKKYLDNDTFKQLLISQCVFCTKENAVARIVKIDFQKKEIEAYSIFEKYITRHFDEVIFFDVYSIQAIAIFEKQRVINDSFSYNYTHRFLTHSEKKNIQKNANYIIPITHDTYNSTAV